MVLSFLTQLRSSTLSSLSEGIEGETELRQTRKKSTSSKITIQLADRRRFVLDGFLEIFWNMVTISEASYSDLTQSGQYVFLENPREQVPDLSVCVHHGGVQ